MKLQAKTLDFAENNNRSCMFLLKLSISFMLIFQSLSPKIGWKVSLEKRFFLKTRTKCFEHSEQQWGRKFREEKLVINWSANFAEELFSFRSFSGAIKNSKAHNKINYDYKHQLLFKQ